MPAQGLTWELMKIARFFSPIIGITLLSTGLAAVAGSAQQGVQLWLADRRAEAVSLWQPLAAQGDDKAMLYLAFAYRTGQGIKRDDGLAFVWYKRAAQAGLPEAQIELSLMYELGVGTAPDAAEASGWYSLATREDFCPSELPAGGLLGHR